MIMNKIDFMETVKDKIVDYLPAEIRNVCEVKVVNVNKHNDVVKQGITIFDKDKCVSKSNCYLDEAYQDYLEYGDMEGILRDLAQEIEATWNDSIPDDILKVVNESVKDRIIFTLADTEKNRMLLSNSPHHIDDSGLAFMYSVSVSDSARIPIDNDFAKLEGYENCDFLELARKNMKDIYTPVLSSLLNATMASECSDVSIINLLETEGPVIDDLMYVLTNDKYYFGASSLFYDGIKEKIGDIFGCDYYAVPASVHEWMIVPDRGICKVADLVRTLRTGNEISNIRDVLSDDVYRYSRESNALTKVEAA